jgi:hypothetical protein
MTNNSLLYSLMQLNKVVHYNDDKYTPAEYRIIEHNKEKDGYHGVVAINDREKIIVICNAGTKLDKKNILETALDFVSDAQIFTKQTPEQYKSALKFTQAGLKNLPEGYQVIISGFSLGAVLSDLVTYKLSKKHPQIKSITFENPGSQEIICKTFGIDEIADKSRFEVYNAAVPNMVNIIGHKNQAGETHLVCLDHGKFTDDMGKIGNILIGGHAFDNFSSGSFDDDNHIRLCGKSAVLEQLVDAVYNLF